jgi:hypothetical protein
VECTSDTISYCMTYLLSHLPRLPGTGTLWLSWSHSLTITICNTITNSNTKRVRLTLLVVLLVTYSVSRCSLPGTLFLSRSLAKRVIHTVSRYSGYMGTSGQFVSLSIRWVWGRQVVAGYPRTLVHTVCLSRYPYTNKLYLYPLDTYFENGTLLALVVVMLPGMHTRVQGCPYWCQWWV